MIFLDITKAFDMVWHKGLLFKLRQFGVEGSFHRWCESYLYNGKQRVVINGCESQLVGPTYKCWGPSAFYIRHIVFSCFY